MKNRRVVMQAAVVLVMGLASLLTPKATVATTAAGTCGGICGVCSSAIFCPEVIDQNEACRTICGTGWLSCQDCSGDVSECSPGSGANTSWWCY